MANGNYRRRINPYIATGTANTLLINGFYIDICKGKEILR